ncbi:MAG: EAL domain-containing protein [Pseudomonadota bacterium]
MQSEKARLAALHSYAILDSPGESQFDHIVELVRSLFDTPISLVSLVDADRQWFKAKAGLDAPETPRDVAFCSYAIESSEIFEICDATQDDRFADNPLVTGDPHIRYYAGAPLVTEHGHRLGTLCAIDTVVRRPLDARQREILERLARIVVDEIELYRLRVVGRVAKLVSETASDALIFADCDNVITGWNPAAERMFGWTAAEAIGRSLALIMPERHRDRHADGLKRVAQGGAAKLHGKVVELEALRRDGTEFPIELSLANWQCQGSGRTEGFASIIRDISNRKAMEAERAHAQQFVETVIENLPSMLFVKDAETRQYVRTNTLAADMIGVDRNTVIGRTDADLFGDGEADLLRKRDDMVLESDGVHIFEGDMAGNGPPKLVRTKRVSFSDAGGKRYLLGISDDITDHMRAEEKVAYLANHDGLTGLQNRKAFMTDMLERNRSGQVFDLLLCNIIQFRRINEIHGRPAADALLVQIAHRMKQLLEPGDCLARIGGNELAVLRTGVNADADRLRFAQKVLVAATSGLRIGGVEIALNAKIGGALFPRDGDTPFAVMHAAELALNTARQDKERQIRFFEPGMDVRARRQNRLETDLPGAFERGEMHLAFQPIAGLESGRIEGFETLVRWHHPELGRIDPETFIALAEQNDSIPELGETILARAVAEAAGWNPPLSVAVNVSPGQIYGRDFPGNVARQLDRSGLAPERLELEITEGMLLDNRDTVIAALHALKDIGVRISIDDFGTGYSSMAYFDMFPFDKVKIDQSFVRKAHESKHASAVIRAIIGLGKDLDIPVVAEGLETDADLSLMLELGCAQVQGFLIGKPAPIETFERVIIDRTGASTTQIGPARRTA